MLSAVAMSYYSCGYGRIVATATGESQQATGILRPCCCHAGVSELWLRTYHMHSKHVRAYYSYRLATSTGAARSLCKSYSRVFFQGSFCLQSAAMSARLAQKQLCKLCILQLYSKISRMLTAHNINKLCSLGLMINFKSHRGSYTVVLARKGLCQCCANQEHNPSLSSCAEQELHCPDWHWQEVIPRSGSFHGCVTATLRTHCHNGDQG